MLKKARQFLFENSTTRQTVTKNTFWLSVGNFGGRFIRALILIYAARVLGAAGWGIFSYATSLVALITILADFGIGPLLTREESRLADEKERMEVLSTAFIIKCALLAVGILIFVGILPFALSFEELMPLIPFFALILIFDMLRDFGFAVNRAREKMEYEAWLFILTNAAIAAFGFFALFFFRTVGAFTVAYLLGTMVGMFATFRALRLNVRPLFSYFSAARMRTILSSAWPFALSAFLGSVMINTDILLIGIFRDAQDVGYYSAAQRPILLLYLLPSVIAVSAFPALSRLARTNAASFRTALQKLVSMSALIGFPLAAIGLALGNGIIYFLYGNAYLPAVSSFSVLMLTVFGNFPQVILSNALFALDKQKILVRFAALGSLVNVILDIIFIPRFGIVGSAWATFFAQTISNAYLWHALNKVHKTDTLSDLARIIPASVIAGFAAWVFAASLHFIAAAVAAGFLYILILFAMKEPLIKEVRATLQPRV